MKQTRVTVGLVFGQKFPGEYNEGLILAIQHTLREQLKDWTIPLEKVDVVWFEDQDEWEARETILHKLKEKTNGNS